MRQTVCHLTKQAAMLEAKNVEKNKIIMMLADELLCLSEQDKWSGRSEFTRGLDSIPSTRYAPDFNCTTVEKYLNGGGSVECTPNEKVSLSKNSMCVAKCLSVDHVIVLRCEDTSKRVILWVHTVIVRIVV